MNITEKELKDNLEKYLNLAPYQTIGITRDGKLIATLLSPETAKMHSLQSLIGIIPDEGKSIEDYRLERLERKTGMSI